MPATSRFEYLCDLGYEPPFDESPIETPDGWFGGAVQNTGGNIMHRIWRTWTGSEKEREIEYIVRYNVAQDAVVSLEAHRWTEEFGGYIQDHTAEARESEENSDQAQAAVAKQMMLDHSSI